MSLRTVFSTVSPLPPGISRDIVLAFLHDHQEMIDLNPLVKERHPIPPPPHAPPEELSCAWYSLTDKISYLPGVSGDVTYTCAFTDLPNGIQTHCYAPAELTIRDRWTLNGFLPGEEPPAVAVDPDAPPTGLYIREEVDMRCNMLLTAFVKRNIKKSHAALVGRLKAKAQIESARAGPGMAVEGMAGGLGASVSGTAVMNPAPGPGMRGPSPVRGPSPLPSPGLASGAQAQVAGVGISAQTMRFYEQKLGAQPQGQVPMRGPPTPPHETQTTQEQFYAHVSGRNSPMYEYGSAVMSPPQFQPQCQVQTRHEPQFQPQTEARFPAPAPAPAPVQAEVRPQYPVFPGQGHIPRQPSPSSGFSAYQGQAPQTHHPSGQEQNRAAYQRDETANLSSESYMSRTGLPRESGWNAAKYPGTVAASQREAVYAAVEVKPYVGARPGRAQGQTLGNANPGMGATLSGPFVAELA